MRGPTHRALTILAVCTGALVSAAVRLPTDIASTDHPWLGRLLAIGAASVAGLAGNDIPDRDLVLLRRRPVIGRMIGHRAFTHSLLAIIVIAGSGAICLAALGFPSSGRTFIMGYALHVLSDGCSTGAGVRIFYPLKKRIKLLPRRWRVRREHEALLRRVAVALALGAIALVLDA